MRRGVATFTLALVFAGRLAAPAPIDIQIRGSLVDIRAEGVPLVQVLNGVAWESKMKIVYDAPPPQDPVSVDIKNTTLTDAITQLLRGHGLIYVAKMDAAGTRVETLVLTSGSPGEVRLNAAPADAPAEEPPPDVMPEPPPPEYVPPPTAMTPATPTPEPASAWTPQPITFPGTVPLPTSSPTPFIPIGRMPPGYAGHGAPGAPQGPTQ